MVAEDRVPDHIDTRQKAAVTHDPEHVARRAACNC
jgi:hypothetical protein